MNVEQRQKIERDIAGKTIDVLLKAGFSLGVHNGDELTISKCTKKRKILGEMFTTDQDTLVVYKDDERFGLVDFIYGNDGWDVIADYTMNLSEQIGEVDLFALNKSDE